MSEFAPPTAGSDLVLMPSGAVVDVKDDEVADHGDVVYWARGSASSPRIGDSGAGMADLRRSRAESKSSQLGSV